MEFPVSFHHNFSLASTLVKPGLAPAAKRNLINHVECCQLRRLYFAEIPGLLIGRRYEFPGERLDDLSEGAHPAL